MSRYSKQINETTTLNYGYDHALGFWYDIFDTSKGDEDHECMVEEGCTMFGKNRGQIVEVLQKHEVNEKHIEAIALDIPF